MPTKACCCDPKGRHVAVACRYYGGHSLLYVRDDADGFTGDIRYVGPDGYTVDTKGYQRVFGITYIGPGFGTVTGTIVRGPSKYESVNIKKFDATRDVVILSRSGGGGSQFDWTQSGKPKGGHSSFLQSRIKASLSTEAYVGAGGTGYAGGQASFVGSYITESLNSHTVSGAGAAGGNNGRGGHGGITNGIKGFGLSGGGGGSQTSGGSAGGPNAGDGSEYFGGSGGSNAGGGGGGKYGGGGGDNKAGGGGGSSKWPSGTSFDDIKYSEEGSDRGPGNVCDPFIGYYTLVGDVSASVHAGMGGGANILKDVENPGPGDKSMFLGFGNDFNPIKDGAPGLIKVLWIDKYCPCSDIGATGENGNIGSVAGDQGQSETGSSQFKADLPDKLYICLTDAQFRKITEAVGYDASTDFGFRPKFELDGETYIYLGVCTNAYCPDVRLVEGEPENIRLSDINSGQGQILNDCCKTTICAPVCKIRAADCFECNNCYACIPNPKWKYCCDGVEDKPDRYWSVYQGYLWTCTKSRFWFPFGKTPEDNDPFREDVIFDLAINYLPPLEKACLPVGGDLAEEPIPYELCDPPSDGFGSACDDLTLPPYGNGESCKVEVGDLWQNPHPNYLPIPINVTGKMCGKFTNVPYLTSVDLISCECMSVGNQCLPGDGCLEENTVTVRYNSFCTLTPTVVNGSYGDCFTYLFSPNVYATKNAIEITNYMDPILGLTITIPKCVISPTFSFPITNVFGWGGMCGRVIKILNEFGLNLGTVASALNDNPFGIVYTANEPRIWVYPRYGAQVCEEAENLGYSITAPEDLFVSMIEEETSTTYVKKYYYKPRTYVYFLEFGAQGAYGSSSQYCSGTPSCECVSPYKIGESQTTSLSQTCMWGLFDLVRMNQPVFIPGVNNEAEGTCNVPPSLLSQIRGTVPPEILSPLAYSKQIAICKEYENACLTSAPIETISCRGSVSGSVG